MCAEGDWSTPPNCSALLHSLINVTEAILLQNHSTSLVNLSTIDQLVDDAIFSYEKCPDVEECLLGIASCHVNSTCINTNESYICECDRGYGLSFPIHTTPSLSDSLSHSIDP